MMNDIENSLTDPVAFKWPSVTSPLAHPPKLNPKTLLEMQVVAKQSWTDQAEHEQHWITMSNKRKQKKAISSAVLTGKRPVTRSHKQLS